MLMLSGLWTLRWRRAQLSLQRRASHWMRNFRGCVRPLQSAGMSQELLTLLRNEPVGAIDRGRAPVSSAQRHLE